MQLDSHGLRPLQEYFSPKALPHREQQLQFLQKQFEQYRSGNHTSNVFLRGQTGTGKSATITQAIRSLSQKDYVLVRGTEARTPTQVLRGITDSTYRTDFRLLTHALDIFRFQPKIIVIDEIDKIARRAELFTHLNTIYRETGIPIIIISNVLALLRNTPDDARLTLLFHNLDFQPYNATELRDILLQRLEALPKEIQRQVPEYALSYICAKGAREGDGNARVAREALLKCLLNNSFSQEFIDSLFNEIASQDWVEFYNGFTQTEKNFLNALIDLNLKKQGQDIKAKELHNALPGLSPQRISQLITHFENQMVVETKMMNAGSKGRYRTIRFSSREMAERLGDLVESRITSNNNSEKREVQLGLK